MPGSGRTNYPPAGMPAGAPRAHAHPMNIFGDDENIQIDGVRNGRRRHELIERLAVPTFDWVSAPIVAMAEALAPSTRADLPTGRAAPHPANG